MISCLVEGRGSTAAPQQQYVVVYGDGGVTIRWNASTDEAGKPPVSGYELQRREVDSDEWSAPVDVTAPTVFINVCNRTEQVRDAIVAAAGASACGEVLAQRLAAITELWVISRGITSLKANDFSGLTALKSLNLANNAIGSIPAGIFTDLAALEFLNMPHSITNLPANVFYSLSALRKLEINNNELVGVNVAAFSGLAALEELWLGQNKLHSTSLPAGVFGSLARLRTLELRRNQINSLPAGIFPGLTSLTELDVSGNPTDPLPITISLELTAAGQFRASAHTGAPGD